MPAVQHSPTRRQFMGAVGLGVATTALAQPRPRAKSDDLPTTGTVQKKLAKYDELMTSFLREHKAPGAALAVSRGGRLVYARGFGYADVEKKTPVEPNSLFRIASISKPITSVAVFRLIEKGKLKTTDKVFSLLKVKPFLLPKATADDRLADVTIAHCLQHTGGWDRAKGFDPMGAAAAEETALALRVKLPVQPEQIIRYAAGKPLDFDPGTAFAYSNFGYCLLGRVIEQVSGVSYSDFVTKEVLTPLGIKRMRLGKNQLRDRAADEVKYYDMQKRTGRAVCGPNIGKQVPLPYGVELLESMDANGGWIASAVDLVKFGVEFDDPSRCRLLKKKGIEAMLARPDGKLGLGDDGQPRPVYYGSGWNVRPDDGGPGRVTKWHGGGLAGTETFFLCRGDGTNWAVLFNGDTNPNGKNFIPLIDPLLHQTADAITDWPVGDLFPKFYPPK